MGTEQSSQLASKQVIGEWDLRTFQEIASLVSRLNPNLDTVLEKPAFKRKSYTAKDKEGFFKLLQSRIGDSHCLLMGSPDVNPVVEIALARLKGIEAFSAWQERFDNEKSLNRSKFSTAAGAEVLEGYVPFKNYKTDRYEPKGSSFFAQFDSTDPYRGFLYYDETGANPKKLH